MKSNKTRKCSICGKPFKPVPHNRSVCYSDHYHPCPVCGKDVLCNDSTVYDCGQAVYEYRTRN